ncbi:MAG TPA: c-type cytochrome, partial [Methylomirabilota bacterium]|nr:c-type cytochrome [Methylomirabilota bacterium]
MGHPRIGRLSARAAALIVLLALASISSSKTAIDPSVQRGQQMFAKHCAICHGPLGKGDGAVGNAMPVKPADLTDGRLMNPLPDHALAKIIGEGGQAVGLSPLMPGWKPFLTPREIQDLIAHIRTLATPPFAPEETLPVPAAPEGPEQPIFFSHLVHAGRFRIDCQYCHAGARRSLAAGIPSVERCMGCHKIVAAQGNPEVQKLQSYYQRREPIPWVRIFKLPEYTYFPHKNHLRAGVQCQTCHGRVEAMERLHARTGQSLVND